jgi:hypothetical protein
MGIIGKTQGVRSDSAPIPNANQRNDANPWAVMFTGAVGSAAVGFAGLASGAAVAGAASK